MSIICGIDFSEAAGRAAAVAARLAAANNEELWLVHVREEQPASGPAREQEEVARARLKLETEAKALLGRADIHTEIRSGLPDEQLLQLATEKGARLIVVAALG